jgi:hypothetical protein
VTCPVSAALPVGLQALQRMTICSPPGFSEKDSIDSNFFRKFV